jgi:hypothetical protein
MTELGVRKYRADYNNRPPSAVSFMPAIASTSDRLHSEFVRLLFLQVHRETDRFFAVAGLRITLNLDGAPIISRTHTHSLYRLLIINIINSL